MPDIKQLYELQETDLDIAAHEAEIAAVELDLADESDITTTRGELQEIADELEKLAATRREYERTIEGVTEQVQKIEKRLYSGSVTNPKELTAADEERAFTQARRGEYEERLLEVLVEIEDREDTQSRAGGKLEQLEAERPSLVAQLTDQKNRLSEELADLRGRRDDLIPRLPAQAIALYDSLRKSKDGHAVARVERGMCQGCRLTLSSGELQHARSNQNVVQCSSCRRILYVV